MSSSKPKKYKGKGLQRTKDDQLFVSTQNQFQPLTQAQCLSMPDKNLPLDPCRFYLRDHELYYTALNGPRYNEYAIFIDFHEWYLSANSSFYEYLKIIKAYRSLLQSINNHPVLIVLPTGYVETCRFFHIFTYWKPYDAYVIHFVQKVIPDVHICLHDFLSYHTRFFTTTLQVQHIIPRTCVQMSHHDHNCICHQITHYDIHCCILQAYARRISLQQKILNKQTNSDDDTISSASSSSPPKPEAFQDSQDPYEL